MAGPTIPFWQGHFDAGTIPWDRGGPGPQVAVWLDGDIPPGTRLLVPGCGSGWDVAAFARAGMTVTGVDYTPAAVAAASSLLAREGLAAEVVLADVLAWSPPRPVDAIYEQTCLCALHPDHWTRYAVQLQAWLRPGGRLFALFMQRQRPGAREGLIEGPPFHCDINAMRALLPLAAWDWPKPPYPAVPHHSGAFELAVMLTRR